MTNAGNGRDHRGEDEDDLVGGLRDDVLLERQLHAVGERLQQAERAVHVGADPVLHPGHDAALPPDVEQREQHQDQEDQHGLDQDQPPRVLPELRQVVGGRSPLSDGVAARAHHWFAPFTVTRLPGEARLGQHAVADRVGGHPDGAVGRVSATSAGRVTEPRSPVTVTDGPSASYMAAETRATGTPGGGAAGAPRRPASSRGRSSASRWRGRPGPRARRAGRRTGRRRPRATARSPSQPPISSICTRASATVRKPSGRAQLLGDAGQHPQVGQRAGVAEDGLEGPQPALPVDERAGLVGDRARPGRPRRRPGSRRSRAARGRPRTGGGDGRAGGRGVGGVVGVDATDDQAAELAGGEGGDDRVGVAALGLGQAVDAPGGGDVDAGGRRRRPGGRRAAGSAGSRSRPRRGHRRGAGPRPAGHRSSRPARPPRSARRARWRAARRRGSRRSCRRRTRPARRARRAPRPRRRAGSAISWPFILRRPREVYGASETTRVPVREALRSRRKIAPASSSGSRPARTTVGGALEVGVRDGTAQHDLGGEEARLLRGDAAGPGSRCRWCRARPGRTCCRRRRPRR